MIAQAIAACLIIASQTYDVPKSVMFGIYQVERGQIGKSTGPNKNGTYDVGPMQINTVWLPQLAGIWGVSHNTAYKWLQKDPCTNAGVAAWILRRHYDETGDMWQAIAHYHSKTPHIGKRYRKRVVLAMRRYGYMQ